MMSNALLYFEPQESLFCAVHAVNNLLQGPLFTEWVFSEIAIELTEAERKLMAAGGVDSTEYLNWMSRDSQHVDDSGNFSIEVIKKALDSMSLSTVAIGSLTDAAADPNKEVGFICNHSKHWIAVR